MFLTAVYLILLCSLLVFIILPAFEVVVVGLVASIGRGIRWIAEGKAVVVLILLPE